MVDLLFGNRCPCCGARFSRIALTLLELRLFTALSVQPLMVQAAIILKLKTLPQHRVFPQVGKPF
jgi:hypothetical protein